MLYMASRQVPAQTSCEAATLRHTTSIPRDGLFVKSCGNCRACWSDSERFPHHLHHCDAGLHYKACMQKAAPLYDPGISTDVKQL